MLVFCQMLQLVHDCCVEVCQNLFLLFFFKLQITESSRSTIAQLFIDKLNEIEGLYGKF